VPIEAKDDGGGGDNWATGAISRAKLQPNLLPIKRIISMCRYFDFSIYYSTRRLLCWDVVFCITVV